MSAEITERDLELALEIVTSEELFEGGDRPERYVAQHLADARREGRIEGLERAAYELGWPDPRGLWRAADVLRAMARGEA